MKTPSMPGPMARITDDLVESLRPLRFGAPVSTVYNPLEYARKPYEMYWSKWGRDKKQVVFIGMNPGPWGMAQTGVPFGEVSLVRDWLRITAPVGTPAGMHPKRPVRGFACEKSEVSGRRLWGWAKKAFGTPERFFSRFFVANYCPLLFLEKNGRNKTPDTLRAGETRALFEACDRALRRTIAWMNPAYAVGVGRFAEKRASIALAGLKITIGGITHPSPANPRANRGWEQVVGSELAALGIALPKSTAKKRRSNALCKVAAY